MNTNLNKKPTAKKDFISLLQAEMKTEHIEFAYKFKRNLIVIGNHGTGKTGMVLSTLKRILPENEVCLYLNAATLDVWTDFVGVPFKSAEKVNGKEYLEFIRRIEFAKGNIGAIVIDEVNRTAHKKIEAALMEIVQFGTINGEYVNANGIRPVVYAMANPPGRYHVNEMDPAFFSRFTLKLKANPNPDYTFFAEKFGDEMGTGLVNWYMSEDDGVKELVSPRDLEELGHVIRDGGLIAAKWCLPSNCNLQKLRGFLGNVRGNVSYSDLFASGDRKTAREFMYKDSKNNLAELYTEIELANNEAFIKFFVGLLDEEDFALQMSTNDTIYNCVLANVEEFQKQLFPIVAASVDKRIDTVKIAADKAKVNLAQGVRPTKQMANEKFAKQILGQKDDDLFYFGICSYNTIDPADTDLNLQIIKRINTLFEKTTRENAGTYYANLGKIVKEILDTYLDAGMEAEYDAMKDFACDKVKNI